MTMTSYKPKLNADATYENLQLVARDLLAKINEQLDGMPRLGSAGIAWTHVGDLAEVVSKLSEVSQFITGYSR